MKNGKLNQIPLKKAWLSLGLAGPLYILAGGAAKPAPQEDSRLGYEAIALGMDYDDALAAVTRPMFHPISLRSCQQDLQIYGCVLYPKDRKVGYTEIEGTSFGLSLSFNRHRKLTDMRLHFRQSSDDVSRASIKPDDCLARHNRAVDWLTLKFGPLNETIGPRAEGKRVLTAKKNGYWYVPTSMGFSASGKLTQKNKQSVILQTSYWDDKEKSCRIDISISDSIEVERRLNKMFPERNIF